MDYRFYQNSADVISILARVDMQRYAEVHRCCYPLKLPPRCIIQLWSRIEADVCRRLSPQCTSMFFAFWWKKPHKSYFHGTIGKLNISDIVLFKQWWEFRGLEVNVTDWWSVLIMDYCTIPSFRLVIHLIRINKGLFHGLIRTGTSPRSCSNCPTPSIRERGVVWRTLWRSIRCTLRGVRISREPLVPFVWFETKKFPQHS